MTRTTMQPSNKRFITVCLAIAALGVAGLIMTPGMDAPATPAAPRAVGLGPTKFVPIQLPMPEPLDADLSPQVPARLPSDTGALPSPPEPAPALPACESEDSDNCYWDAATMGNGLGDSFYVIDGVVTYTTK